jgi:guanylate kinase
MKIIIIAPGASGKDYLRKKLEQKGQIYSLSSTSRPMREGEVEGKDYNFITREEFEKRISEGFFLEWREYVIDHNTKWYYGTPISELERADVFIITPDVLEKWDEETLNKFFIIYLNPSEDVRRTRLSQRNDADSVERRIESDRELFSRFNRYDLIIKNEDF